MFEAIAIGLGLLGLFFVFRKDSHHMGTHDGSVQLTPNYYVRDFLVSSSVPALRTYKLDDAQLSNATQLAMMLEELNQRSGIVPRISSGGRPQDLADFVTILRKRGYKAAEHSRHATFSAADLSYGDDDYLREAYEVAKQLGFGEVILYAESEDPRKNHLHVALPDAMSISGLGDDAAFFSVHCEGEGC